MRMKQLPCEERPRERLESQGVDALSNIELIAVILGSGTQGKPVLTLAAELLARFSSFVALAEASITELCELKGLGKAKAIQLKAALGISHRLAKEIGVPKGSILTAEQAYLFVRDHLAYQKKEIFGVILQDVRGCAIKWEEISVGTLTQTLVHPREVFYPAVQHRAASLILAHNHPSGDPSPSPQDLHLTRILIQAGRLFGIHINDHIIVTNSGYVSLKECGVFV